MGNLGSRCLRRFLLPEEIPHLENATQIWSQDRFSWMGMIKLILSKGSLFCHHKGLLCAWRQKCAVVSSTHLPEHRGSEAGLSAERSGGLKATTDSAPAP